MDPEIAPLARRLAEENNVDWRRLTGSGSEGRIVERDVLDFLARVMAGEEELDPTPEPLPDGLDAWPEEGDAPIGAPTGEGHDRRDAADAATASGDDDLLLAGDDLIDADDDDDLLLGGGETHVATEAPDAAPDLFAEDDAGPERREPAPDLFMDDDEADDESDDRRARDLSDDVVEEDPGFDFGGLPGVREAQDEVAGPFDMDATDMHASDMDAAGMGGAFAEGRDAHDLDLDADGVDTDGLGTNGRDRPVAPPPPPSPAAPSSVSHDATDRTPSADGVDAPRAAAPSVPAPDPNDLPLVRSRSVLRRHVDFGPALEVRRSVALEAGRDDLPASAVLLAAARKVAGTIDASRPGVAVQGEGGRVRAVVPEGTGLAAIASAIASAADDRRDDGDVDLWIVDLSDLGIDEVVLDVEAPQLVLGRVMTDGDDGSVRATLSLVAEIGLERGSAFLTRVADLIEEPLRLLA